MKIQTWSRPNTTLEFFVLPHLHKNVEQFKIFGFKLTTHRES